MTALETQIVERLSGEVDRPQAELFARRFLAVSRQLAALSPASDEARRLAVALDRRMVEVLAGPPPRALRVRALADFYYSRAGVIFHSQRRRAHGQPALSIQALAESARWRTLAPGVAHATAAAQLDQGPAHINLLRAAPGAVALRCAELRAEGGDLVAAARARGAVAAVSGGFFLYSEPDIAPPSRRGDPVGLLIADGRVLSPPVFARATLGFGARAQIAILGPAGATLSAGGRTYRIRGHNQLGPACLAYNRAWGPRSPAGGGPAFAVVGDAVVASGAPPLDIPLAGLVIHCPHTPAPRPGAAVRWDAPAAGGEVLRQAVAGGPLLVTRGQPFADHASALAAEDFRAAAPPRTFSGDETGDQNLLPRMAAGLTADGALIFAAVDGRNFHRALGMTLRGLAELMVALGCRRALNLDGGSSKRMAVQGQIVDLTSTEVLAGPAQRPDQVRPVHSAIFLTEP